MKQTALQQRVHQPLSKYANFPPSAKCKKKKHFVLFYFGLLITFLAFPLFVFINAQIEKVPLLCHKLSNHVCGCAQVGLNVFSSTPKREKEMSQVNHVVFEKLS